MNDRELLEMAAKALGWVDYPDDPIECGQYWHTNKNTAPFGVRFRKEHWQPLTDDGDALRLAVKLRIRHERHPTCAFIAAFVTGVVGRFEEPEGSDPYAATRRAIVRAAAEIGRGMK